MRFWGLFFIILSFVGCQYSKQPIQTKKTTVFFDLKAFFEKEARHLDNQKTNLEKTIRHNGKTEAHEVQIKEWTTELKLFSDSDINKPSWTDKYQLDSSTIDKGLVLMRYKALDENLEVQALDIKLSDSTVHSILIIKKIENPVYESQQYLTYVPNKGYTIEKTQSFLFSTKEEYNIQAKYVFNSETKFMQ